MAIPGNPRDYSKLVFATGNSAMFGGAPGEGTLFKNRMVYPFGDYVVSTNPPTIRVFDGIVDRGVASIPNNVSNVMSQAVVSMLAVNGTVYLSTFDAGTDSTSWEGRVMQFDPDTGNLTDLGARFTGGHIPYSLAWHMGRLWVGTNLANGNPGKVYWIRPGIDTAFTLDRDLTGDSLGGVCSMLSFQGNLYVGTDNVDTARGKILKRINDGTYSVVETGSGGTAKVNNGYYSMCEFNAALYTGYFNKDTPNIAKIRKYDGTSWTTAYTGTGTTLIPFVQLFVDLVTLYAIGGGPTYQGVLLSTPDGTTWTDLSAQLLGTATCLPLHAVVTL